mmetsp:Transcript_104882/g.292656  ORF Transcript_104882/g.292656 Transcript_104882/m.292656 type:complete len:246 (-) Transcript_104882:277-1014(-)
MGARRAASLSLSTTVLRSARAACWRFRAAKPPCWLIRRGLASLSSVSASASANDFVGFVGSWTACETPSLRTSATFFAAFTKRPWRTFWKCFRSPLLAECKLLVLLVASARLSEEVATAIRAATAMASLVAVIWRTTRSTWWSALMTSFSNASFSLAEGSSNFFCISSAALRSSDSLSSSFPRSSESFAASFAESAAASLAGSFPPALFFFFGGSRPRSTPSAGLASWDAPLALEGASCSRRSLF